MHSYVNSDLYCARNAAAVNTISQQKKMDSNLNIIADVVTSDV